MVSGPQRPLPGCWDTLVDPAWLLLPGWQLSAGGQEQVGGRRGWQIWAHRGGTPQASPAPGAEQRLWFSAAPYDHAAAVIDAELGVALRVTFFAGGQPAACCELLELTTAPVDGGTFDLPDLAGLPGRRLVEGDGPLAHLDIPEPLRAAGQAGRAGVKLLAGLLGQDRGPRRDNPRDVWDDASDS